MRFWGFGVEGLGYYGVEGSRFTASDGNARKWRSPKLTALSRKPRSRYPPALVSYKYIGRMNVQSNTKLRAACSRPEARPKTQLLAILLAESATHPVGLVHKTRQLTRNPKPLNPIHPKLTRNPRSLQQKPGTCKPQAILGSSPSAIEGLLCPVSCADAPLAWCMV